MVKVDNKPKELIAKSNQCCLWVIVEIVVDEKVKEKAKKQRQEEVDEQRKLKGVVILQS